MRISLITQWFDPEGGSAAIPGAMVRSLQKEGHQLHVVTGFPNYPTGQIYDGYRLRLLEREQRDDVTVHRVALYPSHDSSPMRRALNFLSFMVTSSTIGAWLARQCDVALVYSTPATVGAAGVVLSKIYRRPFVLFVQDLWPDTLEASGMLSGRAARALNRPLSWFCSRVYRAASRIAVISPGMKNMLIERGVPAAKIDVVYNWVDQELFNERAPRPSTDQFTLMYAGNVGDVQGLETLVLAMTTLGDAEDLRVRVVGGGVALERIKRLCVENGVEAKFDFLGPQPVERMPELMATADVQLVSLIDQPLFHATMPSKIQAIMAVGHPIISSVPGDAARVIEASGAGFVAAPEDAQSLADAIRAAQQTPKSELVAMGERGRDFYDREMSAKVGAARLGNSLSRAKEQRDSPCASH